MKNFLAVYIGSDSNPRAKEWEKLSEADRNKQVQKAMAAWGEWGAKYSKVIVDQGAPLGKTKKADNSGISNIKNQMTAYAIVKAETHEEAAKMFAGHPHFSIFPGDSIEIMECLPMPGGN